MHDRILSAYATLELEKDAPFSKIRRQYRTLVRRWHPDRFAGNCYAVAEATERLRAINEAYEVLVAAHLGSLPKIGLCDESSPKKETAPLVRPPSDLPNREQIDQVVTAILQARRSLLPSTADRWSRALSAVIAATDVMISVWLGWYQPSSLMPVASALGPVSTILLALISLTMIWYLDQHWRIIGWTLLLLFGVIIPLVAAVILHYA